MPIYLDCNATTPMDSEVYEQMIPYFLDFFGNSGSRTHMFGQEAKKAVQEARRKIASTLGLRHGDRIIFTSGATESDNLAMLGLIPFAKKNKKTRIIVSLLEHKAILEPAEYMAQQGFDVVRIGATPNGQIDLSQLEKELTPETFLVSIMHVNNETNTIQPLNDIAQILKDHSTFFHTDAAQGFGKDWGGILNSRIDMISISGHKINASKGIGALITRRREFEKVPLAPIVFGGGQEDGYRAGTLAVPLIVSLGVAAEISKRDASQRHDRCMNIKNAVKKMIENIGGIINGDPDLSTCTGINFSIPGLDSEAIMLALKDVIAISNGSACTSQSYTPSHVLTAMGLDSSIIRSAVRLSWCHLTPDVDWSLVENKIRSLR